jgi:hypothetical protein
LAAVRTLRESGAVLQVEQSEPDMAEHQISLVDGGTLVAVDEEWPALASSSFGTLHGGAYLIARLAVRRHRDGRTLVHLAEQVGGKEKHSGVLLGDATPDALHEAGRALAESHELPMSLVDECLGQM